MLEVKKGVDSLGYDFYKIKTKEGIFQIFWGGNGDLYWTIYPSREIKNKHTIEITKGEYELYSLFNEVYDAIASCKPFKYAPKLGIESLSDEEDRFALRARDYLLQDGIITWISDDEVEDLAAKVSIKKCEDKYEITFNRGTMQNHETFTINFCNSGSKYDPFNVTFDVMYKKLKYYDEDNCQIHIEEYLYEQKIKKMKKKQ